MKNKILTIAIALLFTIGIGLISYPIIGTIVSDFTSTRVIQNYENQVNALSPKIIKSEKAKQKLINDKLKQITENPLLEQENINKNKNRKKTNKKEEYLNKTFKEGEMLGFLTIPKIKVMQPICEGIKESTLSHAVGHLNGTSMPYGGKSTHCCITGHSGLSYSTMLSELDKIELNDVFYIKVLDEVHEYKVDNKRVVKPYGADKYFKIEKDKDYVTIATCFPITVNTHRLLIRGRRIPYDGKLKNKITDSEYKLIILTVVALLIICVIVTVYILRKKYRRKK